MPLATPVGGVFGHQYGSALRIDDPATPDSDLCGAHQSPLVVVCGAQLYPDTGVRSATARRTMATPNGFNEADLPHL
jgi:hypothetical protein